MALDSAMETGSATDSGSVTALDLESVSETDLAMVMDLATEMGSVMVMDLAPATATEPDSEMASASKMPAPRGVQSLASRSPRCRIQPDKKCAAKTDQQHKSAPGSRETPCSASIRRCTQSTDQALQKR